MLTNVSRTTMIVALCVSVAIVALQGMSHFFWPPLSHYEGPIDRPSEYTAQVAAADINLMNRPLRYEGPRLLFQPRDDLKSWPLDKPLDWSANPFNDRNWQYQLHSWRMMDPLLRAYMKSHDEAKLAEAFQYALDWYDFHWVQARNARMSWYDMSAGLRAFKLGLFFDRYLSGDLKPSAEDTRKLFSLISEHAKRLQDEDFIAMGNHGLFQVFGLNLMCSIARQVPDCKHAPEYANRMFSKVMETQFTNEGVHKEHSPAYHYFVRLTIISLGGAEKFGEPELIATLKKAEEVEPWFVGLDGKFVPVGDTSGGRKQMQPPKQGEIALGDFTKSGYAVVKAADSMLFVMGMANDHRHKHADDLSFVLYEKGRPLFIDTGKYGYNEDDMRRYVVSAKAHNTVSLEDNNIRPQDIRYTGSSLTQLERQPKGVRIRGHIERPGFFSQERQIDYEPAKSITIRDHVRSNAPRQYVSSLHLASDLKPKLTENGFDVTLAEGIIVRAKVAEPDCRVEMLRGSKSPVAGWQSIGYLKVTPASVVRAHCQGQDRTITWQVSMEKTSSDSSEQSTSSN